MLKRIALEPSRYALHIAVLIILLLWTLPTAGLLISSLRDKNQIAASGWWTALHTTDRSEASRMKGMVDQVEKDGNYTISGNLLEGSGGGVIKAFGNRVQKPSEFPAGTRADIGEGQTLQVNADGSYVLASPTAFTNEKGARVSFVSSVPPRFTLENYQNV